LTATLGISSSAQDQELAYERFVRANLRRNYAAHYLHGMLGMTGFRLVNAPTFIPAYLHLLSSSKTVVGLALGLQQLGAVVSPILGATQIEHRKRVLPIATALGTMMRVQILGLALSGFLLRGQRLLIAVIAFLFLLGLFTGTQRVAFQLLLAKVIPVDMRGRLQAWRSVTGGLIAALLSYCAGRYFIGKNLFGNGYATTFLVAFVLTSMGLFALRILMREPLPPTVRARMPLVARLREFPPLLKSDRGFRYFLIAQTCAVAGRIATPFYVLYASKTVALTGDNLGLLSFAYLGADTVANLAWGYVGDRLGFRSIMIAALSIWVLSTGVLMSSHGVALIFVAFFGLGAAQSGYLMSASTMVLEFGHRDEIAMRLALSTTAEGAMAATGPLVGGVIASASGYRALFLTSMALEVVALVLMLFVVEEPRKRRQAASFS
jgi:MFS family permease